MATLASGGGAVGDWLGAGATVRAFKLSFADGIDRIN